MKRNIARRANLPQLDGQMLGAPPRGPYGRGRIIDLTRAAARKLDMIGSGTALVGVERQ